MSAEQIMASLKEPFRRDQMSTRKIGGRQLDYVEGHEYIARLNEASPSWSFQITKSETTMLQVTRYNKQRQPVEKELPCLTVYGELTIPGVGTRAGIGVQMIEDNAGEDVMKGALTDCLKNCAKYFGLGLHMYSGDAPAPPQPRQDAPRTREVAPRSTEQRIGTPDTPNGTERLREPVMRELHAVAKSQLGWDHDQLKAYYTSQGYDSLKAMSVAQMQTLARTIRDDPAAIRDSAPPPLEDEWQVEMIDLTESGSVDVKDWEQMTRKAGREEGRWVQLWDACPTSLIANMLRWRTKEEDMLTDKVKLAREEARRRLTEVTA